MKNLRSLLMESDIVISAAGSTVYEASSIGVPMVVFYFAENQRQGAEALAACTEITNAGCFAEEGSAVADRIREAVRRCISDSAYRERLCQQGDSADRWQRGAPYRGTDRSVVQTLVDKC